MLLSKLGTDRIENPSKSALVTKRADGTLAIALWNYAEAEEEGTPRSFVLDLQNIAGRLLKLDITMWWIAIMGRRSGSGKRWGVRGFPLARNKRGFGRLACFPRRDHRCPTSRQACQLRSLRKRSL